MFFDIVIIRSHPISYDPRVIKIVRSLSKKYNTLILGWDREYIYESQEFMNSRSLIKRLKLKAPYGRIIIILYYPLFWLWIFINLILHRPKIIHACDLETVIPCYFYKILFSKCLIFDSFDRYAMAFILRNHFIYAIVNKIEDIFASKSDALITVSKARMDTFHNYQPKNITIINNCPEDKPELLKDRSILDNGKKFTLIHAGGITHKRGLPLIDRAIYKIKDVHFILAGRLIDKEILTSFKHTNFEYIGVLSYDEALKLQSSADVLPILYDPSFSISKVANPNRLFEAMMLGIPIITNVCEEIVNKTNCGILVEYNINSVYDALLYLKNNPDIRTLMGANGRVAFKKKYNWLIMEKKLLNLYRKLLTY